MPLSVIFNRQGECLELSTVRDDFDSDEDQDGMDDAEEGLEAAALDGPDSPKEKSAQLASEIADMISQINEPGDESPDTAETEDD